MVEDNYSKRELDSKFSGLHDKLDLILSQTSDTKEDVDNLKVWRGFMAGSIAVMLITVVPTIGWLLKQIITISK